MSAATVAEVEHLAPAKLTVSLRITGVRGDGMHLIDAEMVSLDLADRLRFGGAEVSYRGPAAPEALDPDRDLVRRALRAVGHEGQGVVVDKVIPAGAGLGGGSSDAAAVLRWAGVRDLAAAVRLGADVAFCVVGGRARVRGIGEVVEPLPFVERTYTIITPPFGCSTPAVYRAWDALGGPRGANGNDLEPAALIVAPDLGVWRDRIAQRTGVVPRLAGSGSTWFLEGAHDGPGWIVARTIPAPGRGC
jgi:4-diphosphocytidyl-2-C-methyl-D-erythritol kinase